MPAKIVIAYAYSPKFGYQARAFVLEYDLPGLPKGNTFRHTTRTGLGDTANEAMAAAIDYIKADHLRDCGAVPNFPIECRGRQPAALLDWIPA